MILYADMPEDNRDLVKLEVSFPYLPNNTATSCPVPMDDILDYLAVESADVTRPRAEDLKFVRTAQVAEEQYWVWQFTESDGAKCYVTVSVSPEGTACIGYNADYHGLTPEQYMLGDYHNVF